MGTLSQQLREGVEPEDSNYFATTEEWQRFVKGNVWRDFVTFIRDSLEDGRDLLEVSLEERSIKRTDEAIRGGNEILRRVLEFPFVQMRELELLEADSKVELTEQRGA